MKVRDLKDYLDDFDDERTVVVPNARGSARELAEVREVTLGMTEDGDYGKDPEKVGNMRYTATVVALAPTSKPERKEQHGDRRQ